jgi:hypothetical protein
MLHAQNVHKLALLLTILESETPLMSRHLAQLIMYVLPHVYLKLCV